MPYFFGWLPSRPATRDDLCLLLWPDAADAVTRRNLTRLLSCTRQTLPHPDLLSVNQTAISLNPDLVSVDVAQFWQLCAQDDAAALETAVSLVRAPFWLDFPCPAAASLIFGTRGPSSKSNSSTWPLYPDW